MESKRESSGSEPVERGRGAGDGSGARFATTLWTVVLAAKAAEDSQAEVALAKLCRNYWFPLYAYVRRAGHSPSDAEDLTQEFFARLLHRDFLKSVDRERGRFRSFLLASLKHFLANEWDRARAQKRGGGAVLIPLSAEDGEARLGLDPGHELSPEKLFDRNWILAFLDQVMGQLRAESHRAGNGEMYEQLRVFLTGDKAPVSLAEAGKPIGMTEGAVKVAVHRLRRRYRELLREEMAKLVATPGDVDAEIRHLFASLSQ